LSCQSVCLCCSSSKYQCIKFIKKTDSVLEIREGWFIVVFNVLLCAFYETVSNS